MIAVPYSTVTKNLSWFHNRLIFNLYQFVAQRTILYNFVPFLLQDLRQIYIV